MRIKDEAKSVNEGSDVDVDKVVERLQFHEKELDDRTEECEKEAHKEEEEQQKKITSEDIHDGFDVGVSSPPWVRAFQRSTLTDGRQLRSMFSSHSLRQWTTSKTHL